MSFTAPYNGSIYIRGIIFTLLLTLVIALLPRPLFSASLEGSDKNYKTVPLETRPEVRNIQQCKSSMRLLRSFEMNRGQINAYVKFMSRTQYSTLFLTPKEAILQLTATGAAQSTSTHATNRAISTIGKSVSTVKQKAFLRIHLIDANNSPKMLGETKLHGEINYLIGNDRAQWVKDVPHYAKVRYVDVYPGIDWVFYCNDHFLEYDFIVAPGADPSAIQIGFEGVDKMTIDNQGNLILKTAIGRIKHHKPLLYQFIEGEKISVAGSYEVISNQKFRLIVGAYNRSRPLFIDPVLQVITSFAGSGEHAVEGLSVDPTGNIYLYGVTSSVDLPTTTGAYQTVFSGPDPLPWLEPSDAFIAKLTPSGSDFIYLTYLGGSENEENIVSPVMSGGIATNDAGNAYVLGQTQSNDFPITPGAYQTSLSGSVDAFITKLNSNGDDLIYSTFLGGDSLEIAGDLALDTQGNVYITGATESGTGSPFPTTTNAFQKIKSGGWDAFLTVLNADGTALVYSTFFGGSNFSDFAFGVAVDSTGMVWIAGSTESDDFPTKNPLQASLSGGSDIIVAKFDPNASGDDSLMFSTYWGGSGYEHADAIALDNDGNAYITGDVMHSTDFPVKNALQSECNEHLPEEVPQQDAFAAKIMYSGTMAYCTCMGGNHFDEATSVAVDSHGQAYVSGYSQSTDFPPRDPIYQGFVDFVVALEPDGSDYVYQTFLSVADVIAMDPYDNLIVAGERSSTDTPIVVTRIWPLQSYRFVVMADSRGHSASSCLANIDQCVNRIPLQDILKSINQLDPKPNFIFFTGDMIYGNPKTPERIKQELQVWVDTIEDMDLSNNYPGMGDNYVKNYIYPVFGGHERNSLDANYTTAFSAFSEFFDPVEEGQAGLICQYMSTASYGHTAYLCDYGKDRFFILNNDCIPAEDGVGEIDDKNCIKDELGIAQMEWIQQNLKSDGHNFFFHHEPAYGTAAHHANEPDDADDITDSYGNLIDPTATMDHKKKLRNDYIQLIEGNASILFAGHEHQYTRRLINHSFANNDINIDKSIVIIAEPINGTGSGPRTAESFDGSGTQAPLLHIEYLTSESPPQSHAIDVRIKTSGDDVEELPNGEIYSDSSDLELMISEEGIQKAVGLRWTGVSIPQGATITHAHIKFTVDETGSEPAGVRFFGESVDYAAPFSTGTNNVTSRVKTTASVDWDPVPSWSPVGNNYETPDLSSIIQEIIDLPGWHGKLNITREFYEVKTGSCGAPWYKKNQLDYSQSLPGKKIEYSGTTPYHYAVVDVNDDMVQLTVYALNGSTLDTLTREIATDYQNEIEFVPIDLSGRHLLQHLDSDFDGAIDAEEHGFDYDIDEQMDNSDKDTLRILTATGNGVIVYDLDENVHDEIAFRNSYTTTETDLSLQSQNKPERNFPYGLVGFIITNISTGVDIELECKISKDFNTEYEYYDAANWQVIPLVKNTQDRTIIITLTDGGTGDNDGMANGIIQHIGGLASPSFQKVNKIISLEALDDTMSFVDASSDCYIGIDYDTGVSGDYAGIVEFTANLLNTSQRTLSDLVVRVKTLSNGNCLLNADRAPTALGAALTIAPAQAYIDGRLDPDESVEVPFRFCVRENIPFTFEVDVSGRIESIDILDDAPAIQLLRGESDLEISLESEPTVTVGNNLAYKAILKNNGPSDATNVIVNDTLPSNTTFIKAGCEQGVCEIASDLVTCRVDRLVKSEIITAEIIVSCPSKGRLTNTVTVIANEIDSDVSNNTATVNTTVDGIQAKEDDGNWWDSICFINSLIL